MKKYSLNVNGTDYACIEDGAGPLLLLMHGTTGGKQLMLPQVEALSASFRCVAFDWPGHAESGFNPAGWTADDLVEDVATIITLLGEKQAILAGVSQGGAIGMRVALKYPDRVRALVNMCGGPGGPPPAALEKLDQFTKIMAEGNECERREAAITFSKGYLHAPDFAERDPQRFENEIGVLLSHSRKSVQMLFNVPRSYVDITPRLGEIKCPTLVIWAPYDSRPALGEQMAAATPGAKLVTIANAGHHVNVDAPEETTAAIKAFTSTLS
ncbi:alpha/beta fold hydrolase [Sphingobium fluviale]|uniref:Alpha/beta hydrolase n=1 Tax=Sphingobium fluviale TaxID=2506423 RepID=A0A4Q1KAC9_9SPHN|nr:alpha/beta hydrolase [Sphingobium fluviale]RXR23092.1 alpha/beta hydrolase [Sphingobium fluviale]